MRAAWLWNVCVWLREWWRLYRLCVCGCSCKCVSLTPCYWLSLLLCSMGGFAAIRTTRAARTAGIPRIATAVGIPFTKMASIKPAADGTRRTRFGLIYPLRPCEKVELHRRRPLIPHQATTVGRQRVATLWFSTNDLNMNKQQVEIARSNAYQGLCRLSPWKCWMRRVYSGGTPIAF